MSSFDSDETFCEETEKEVYQEKLAEIEKNITFHSNGQVLLTKPQIQDYMELLQTVTVRFSGFLQRHAYTSIKQLQKIERKIETFEKFYSSISAQSSSMTQSTEELPCSLLTNLDFVSQQTQQV